MKNKPGRLSIFLSLPLLIMLSAILSNCAYITGEALEIAPTEIAPTPLPVINNVTPEEAFRIIGTSQNLGNPVIIDVRTPQEYAAGHLERAINIDFNSTDFKENISKLDKDATYVIYCRTGGRSAAASRVMIELGFKHINNMLGGITAWETAGLPVKK